MDPKYELPNTRVIKYNYVDLNSRAQKITIQAMTQPEDATLIGVSIKIEGLPMAGRKRYLSGWPIYFQVGWKDFGTIRQWMDYVDPPVNWIKEFLDYDAKPRLDEIAWLKLRLRIARRETEKLKPKLGPFC